MVIHNDIEKWARTSNSTEYINNDFQYCLHDIEKVLIAPNEFGTTKTMFFFLVAIFILLYTFFLPQ